MRFIFLHIVFVLFFSILIQAQEDSKEELHSVLDFSKDELSQEREFLKFESHFFDAVRQKNIENYDKALSELSVCEKIYPDNVAMLFEKAKNLVALKQYLDASYYCKKALEKEPDNYWVLDLYKDIYVKQRDYQEAITIQKKMYTIKDEAAEGLLRLYYYTKDIKQGQLLLDEIDKKNLYIASLVFYQNFFFSKSKSKDIKPDKPVVNTQSIALLKQAFYKNKSYKTLQILLEKEKDEKDYQSLLSDSDSGLILFPAQAKIYWYKALALFKLKQHKEAINTLENGLDFIVDDVQMSKIFYNLLISLYQSENNTKKVMQYKQLVQKLPIQ